MANLQSVDTCLRKASFIQTNMFYQKYKTITGSIVGPIYEGHVKFYSNGDVFANHELADDLIPYTCMFLY